MVRRLLTLSMDPATLTSLLSGQHLNMPDRIELGLWPHPPLKFSDVVTHLVGVLQSEKLFPREWKSAESGKPVWEGGVIERQSSSRYVYHAQRSHPTNPNIAWLFCSAAIG